MKLFEAFSASGYHTCIATTFCIDFSAFEAIALPRLRGSGCSNNIVVADSRMLSLALGGDSRPPQQAGRWYSVTGATAEGVFHPKIVLQLGKVSARLLVASANLTGSGFSGNLEVVGEVRISEKDMTAAPIIAAAFDYAISLMDSDDSVVAQQLHWARQRSLWLTRVQRPDTPTVLDDGFRTEFIASGAEAIARRFMRQFENEKVEQLIVISPYWDPRLRALRNLVDRLKPKDVVVVIQPHERLFPFTALGKVSAVRIVELSQVLAATKGRFSHAKVIVARTRSRDHVLYGSANCTLAALGSSRNGTNQEACLYREMASGGTLEVLGLAALQDRKLKIRPSAIQEFRPTKDLPIKDLERRTPGRFELRGRTLTWHPRTGSVPKNGFVWLLDADSKAMHSQLAFDEGIVGKGVVHFALDDSDIPSFARVVGDSYESALAVVNVAESIQANQKEARSGGSKKALERLVNIQDEDLWLLDVISEVERAEQSERQRNRTDGIGRMRTGRAPAARNDAGPKGGDGSLSFEDFMRPRTVNAPQTTFPRSGLEASGLDAVRIALNMILGRGVVVPEPTPEPDFDQLKDAFDRRDETANGGKAIEEGTDPVVQPPSNPNKQPPPEVAPDATSRKSPEQLEFERRKAYFEYVRDSQNRLSKKTAAVVDFLNSRRPEGLTASDILRVRVLLMVIACAGTRRNEVQVMQKIAGNTSMKSLPCSGQVSWPALMSQLVFACFMNGGASGQVPLVSLLRLSDALFEVPDDIVEAFSTCLWACVVGSIAVDDNGEVLKRSRNAEELTHRVYAMVAAWRVDFADERVVGVMNGLNMRYAERLGFEPSAQSAEHERLASLTASKRAAVDAVAPSL